MNEKEAKHPPEWRKNQHLKAALLLAIFAAAIFSYWIILQADHSMRAELLQQTRLVAQALDINHIKALSGTEQDLDKPDYQNLKQQLSYLCSDNPLFRFIYLMGRKADGTMFIFLDSESPNSRDYSPPGQIYEEASAIAVRVFNTQSEATEGPVSDRWGTWVSAWIPLTDPANNNLIAVLGFDIDAHVWNWELAARAALPVGLILLLLICIVTFVFARHVEVLPKPVLQRLMPPLAIVVILLVIGTGTILWKQQQQQLDREHAADISDLSHDFHAILGQQATGLAETLQVISSDARVQQALRESDTDSLLSAWQPVFERLKHSNLLTHLYFLDKNRVCLLRVHKPEKRGDIITRFTATEAERSGQTTSGIELGPLGTFTLRVVQPVFEGGSLVGYVELGKEIEDALKALSNSPKLELAISINKEHLNRQAWEDGMRMLGREADWDRLPRSAVIYASLGRLPDTFAKLAESFADGQGPGNILKSKTKNIIFKGKDFLASAIPLQDASGKEVGNLLAMYDISDEKAIFVRTFTLGGMGSIVLLTLLMGFIYVLLRRTDAGILAQQAVLRESEERFRQLFVSSRDALMILGPPSWKFSDGNPAALEIFGVKDTGVFNKLAPWETSPELQPDGSCSRDKALKMIETTLQKGSTFFEWTHRRLDGTEFPATVLLTRTTISGQTFIQATVRDISTQKHAEEEMLRIKVAIDATSEAIGMSTPEGFHFYHNRAFERMFGYTLEEVAGLRPAMIYANKNDAVKVFDTIMSGNSWQGEIEMLTKNGRHFTVLLRAEAIKNENGDIIALIGFHSDITGREQAIEALRESDSRIRIITEREQASEELRKSEANLQQAQRMESVGRLAGGVAHDFNNMLSVILGCAEMALKKTDPAHPLHAFLLEIQKAGNRSADLTRQLLAFARKQTIAPKVLDLNEALAGTLKMLERIIGEGIPISWQPDANLWPVKIDPSQIDQILTNLCINARDAISDIGKIIIKTANNSFDADYCAHNPGFLPGEYATISVSDNGCGIDKEMQTHIFEPFFTTKATGKGTGLGLAMVYGAARQNNGFIHVDSEPGLGSTFRIFLPRYTGKSEERVLKERPLAAVIHGHETILLVEDESAILRMTAMALEDQGYRVLPASTPGEAIRIAKEHRGEIHLLLSDVVMPEMNGRDLAKNLLSLYPQIKRIFMSGYTADVIAHHGVLDEGVQFIQKPFSINDLTAKIREVTAGNK